MKKLHSLILFATIAGSVSAQSNSFLLYSVKGTVSVVENKTETPAKVGKILSNTAALKVGNGGTVTLICNEAAMFSIGKSGTYPLNKFGDSCHMSSGSVSSNYIKYVWAQMTSHGEGSPGSNRKAYMNTVGAVTRGGPNNIWIDQKLDTVNYYSGEFPLSWKSYADAKDFEFSLYSSDNISTPIYTNIAGKLKVSINSFAPKMKQGNSYFWTAAVKGEENDDLKVLNYVTKDIYDKVLNNLKSQGAAFEAPAEQAYRLGFMLEDAHYLSEALQYYTKAATMDSTNVLYRSTLMSFKKDYEIK
jgi:hypothetical protein